MGRKRKNKICGIYCIENIINNKKYIGYSNHITRRFKDHRGHLKLNKHENPYFQYAWNKYGIENFKFWVIQECDESILGDMEIYWIAYYNSFVNDKGGYNLTRGGENPPSFLGKTVKEETKKKIGDKNRGKIKTEETRLKISESRKGKCMGKDHHMFNKHHSDETKEKIGISRKGKCSGENHHTYGKETSEETLVNLSNSHAGKRGKKSLFSKYLGVSANNKSIKNPFRSSIVHRRKRIHLGCFSNEIEAAKTYDKKSWEIYHNLLILNFPSDYIDMT